MVQSAELVLLVLNRNEPLTEEDRSLLQETQGTARVVVLNKSDLEQKIDMAELLSLIDEKELVSISAKSVDGIAVLEEAMEKTVMGGHITNADASYMTNARQAQLLQEAKEDLRLAIEAAEVGATLDIIAVQLQSAYAELGLVIGEEAGEDLLDEIFSNFCLGK